jgi:recombination protein RecT
MTEQTTVATVTKTTTAMATTKKSAADVVDSMKNQWAKVLPKILTPERFARVAISCINRDKTLAEAMTTESGKISILSAFMKCAEMGLEPDGRKAALVAFRKGTPRNGEEQQYDITLIPMFQGLCELALRSGLISYIHADKVCENDIFEWNLGKIESHKPDFKNQRGNAYAYYCHVQFKDGAASDEVMTREEVEAIRNTSSAYKYATTYKKDCPWITSFDEMAKKTVFRRKAKWLPLSPELRTALDADDKDFIDIESKVMPTQNPALIALEAAKVEHIPVADEVQK